MFVAYFAVQLRVVYEGTDENHEKLHNSLFSGRDSKNGLTVGS